VPLGGFKKIWLDSNFPKSPRTLLGRLVGKSKPLPFAPPRNLQAVRKNHRSRSADQIFFVVTINGCPWEVIKATPTAISVLEGSIGAPDMPSEPQALQMTLRFGSCPHPFNVRAIRVSDPEAATPVGFAGFDWVIEPHGVMV